jgi:hypothetical protein
MYILTRKVMSILLILSIVFSPVLGHRRHCPVRPGKTICFCIGDTVSIKELDLVDHLELPPNFQDPRRDQASGSSGV